MNELLASALLAYDTATTASERLVIAAVMREDWETLAEFDRMNGDLDAFLELADAAAAIGSSGFAVLDLVVAVLAPDWQRRPVQGGKLRVRGVRR